MNRLYTQEQNGAIMRAVLGLGIASTWLVGIASAGAVVILDSTWAEEGGTNADPSAGFGAHIDLAYEPQFEATIAFSSDGETVGDCSGAWIGNDDDYAYVLTAAHCFEADADGSEFYYLTDAGTIYEGIELYSHPDYIDVNETTGYDLAIVVLSEPITDLSTPALLYGGDEEYGQLVTFMGYGMRGIGSVGEQDDFHDGDTTKAAAQGSIDQLVESVEEGDYFGIFFPQEDGSLANPYGGSDQPVNHLVGLLGSGDSGGPAFIKTDAGWRLAGVNSNGNGNAAYGQSAWFARVSAFQDWIRSVFPDVEFSDR